jgi:hypothetical protein
MLWSAWLSTWRFERRSRKRKEMGKHLASGVNRPPSGGVLGKLGSARETRTPTGPHLVTPSGSGASESVPRLKRGERRPDEGVRLAVDQRQLMVAAGQAGEAGVRCWANDVRAERLERHGLLARETNALGLTVLWRVTEAGKAWLAKRDRGLDCLK